MGELKKGSPQLRIWAGANEEREYGTVAVIIYRERLPKEASFKEVRKSLVGEIERIVRSSPYSYWVSPKARSWLNS